MNRMGLGERKVENDVNKGGKDECSSPLNQDPEKAMNYDKEDCSSPHTNKDMEKPMKYNKQGFWQTLKSTKVPLIPVLVVIEILILGIIIAAAVPRGGETSTTVKEKLIYIYAECMDDWTQYKGNCYYFSKNVDTWKNSQNFCQLYNSSLVIIDNEKELNRLNGLRGKENHWIGLSRIENDWVWTNKTVYSETIFEITRLGIPPGHSEHVFLNHNGVKSGSGEDLNKWICYKKLERFE